MTKTSKQQPAETNESVSQWDKDHADVPASERGKEENMELERRSPSTVFGIAMLTYMVLLILTLFIVVAVGATFW